MERMLARFSWTPSQDIGPGPANDADDIPLPKHDPDLIDTNFIHWGYANIWHRIVAGKKCKEKWETFWLELCGEVLKLYKDESLGEDSALSAPPATVILPQNERKSHIIELVNAEVGILNVDEYSSRRRKGTSSDHICRRHLFEVKLVDSAYVLQAPSRSSMLWWVMKLHESIDAISAGKIPQLTEERLALAREMRGIAVLGFDECFGYDVVDGLLEEEEEEEEEEISIENSDSKTNPALLSLRKQHILKTEQILQLEAQVLDFYGRGKGDFKRDEFVCTTKQDYFLVPGRAETFIPSGTKVTVFGQLPNHRWRCVVETKELVKVIENLVNEPKEEEGLGTDDDGSCTTSCRMDKEELNNLLNNLPDYPLLGCLPNSILRLENKTKTDHENELLSPKPRRSPSRNRTTKYKITIIPSPPPEPSNVSHKDSLQTPTLLNLASSLENSDESGQSCASDLNINDISIDIDLSELSVPSPEINQIDMQGLKFTDLDSYTTPPLSDTESVSSTSHERDEQEDSPPAVLEETLPSTEGFVIRNKLRQRGIGIVVGEDSSSEEEEDGAQMKERMHNRLRCNGVTNAVFQKYMSLNKAKKTGAELDRSWDSCWSNDQSLNFSQDTLSSCESLGASSGNFSTNQDLLYQFGQHSIHLEQDKALAKALVQVFHESKKGPDVKPPRNERRTLKLSKSDDQGFGFWLQTYNLGGAGVAGTDKPTDTKKTSTFVRYVEDEGPAYLAGLRAGDVIVSVGNQDVEDVEHMKIVSLISETPSELILVVKFLDMVRQVELTMKLNNRRARLKLKEEELKKIEEEEQRILESSQDDDSTELLDDDFSTSSIPPVSSTSSAYSVPLDGDLDLVCLDTSTDSFGSQSSISEDVTVTTSKFEKYSPRVLDSIKEINSVRGSSPGGAQPAGGGGAEPSTRLATTDKDLLSLHSDKDLLLQHSEQVNHFPWNPKIVSIKHHENLFDPAKRNSLPVTLEGYKSRSPISLRSSYLESDQMSEAEQSPVRSRSVLQKEQILFAKVNSGLLNSDLPPSDLKSDLAEDDVFTTDLDDGLGSRTESYKRAQDNVLRSNPESNS